MKRHRKRLLVGLAVALVAAAALAWYALQPRILTSTEAKTPRQRLAAAIPTAVLLWARDGRITISRLKRWKPRSVTEGQNPRWSPDGSRFVFTREGDVWLMKNDLSGAERVLHNVVTQYGTGAYWTTDGRRIVAISRQDPRRVMELNLATRQTRVIHDESRPPYKGFRLGQCAELRFGGRYLLVFTADAGHRSMIVDLEKRRYIANDLMLKGDCEPAWSPDGRFIVMTRRVRGNLNRPLYITYFDPEEGVLSKSSYFIGLGRCHRAAVSNDSRYVLYESSGQIFCWPADRRVEKARNGIQLTADGENSDPSLYIFPGKVPVPLR